MKLESQKPLSASSCFCIGSCYEFEDRSCCSPWPNNVKRSPLQVAMQTISHQPIGSWNRYRNVQLIKFRRASLSLFLRFRFSIQSTISYANYVRVIMLDGVICDGASCCCNKRRPKCQASKEKRYQAEKPAARHSPQCSSDFFSKRGKNHCKKLLQWVGAIKTIIVMINL